MRRLTNCVMGMVLGVALSCQSMAAPIQWVGNNHYYDLVFPDPLVNWHTARDAAASSTYLGASGHLATITSPEEDAFLQANFTTPLGSGWAFIGLTDENIEGQYEWVTGEPFSYSNWRPGEPNNLTHGGAYPEGEDWIHYQQIVEPWGWNDAVNNAAFGYFVEYPVLPPTAVPIDIKPSSDPNSINLKSKGVLPVALLSTADFDALHADIQSLAFGDPLLTDGTPVAPVKFSDDDINGDGFIDRTLKFSIPQMLDNGVLDSATEMGQLTGMTLGGISIVGSDAIRIVPRGSVQSIPEPSAFLLLLVGMGCFAGCRKLFQR